MNDATIFAFVLVWAVVASVGGVLTTLYSRSAHAKLEALRPTLTHLHNSVRTLGADVRKLGADVERTSNSKLAAEVDSLRGALDVHRVSVRKELGGLWGRLGGRGGVILDGDTGQPLGGDDELSAMLALQRAQPVKPGHGNGST